MRRKISRILAGMLVAIVVMSSLDMTTLASERLPETSIQEETGTEDVDLSGSEETEDDSSELISEEVSETSESASETESEESSEMTSEIGSEEVSESTSEIGSEEASESTSETGSEEVSETTSESDSEEDSEGSKEGSELSEENTEQVLSEEENLSNESDGVYTIEATQDEYVWVYSNKDHKLTISVNPNFPGNSAGILDYYVYSEINDQIRAKVSGFDNNSIEIVRYGEGIKYIESYYYSTAIKEIILSDSVEKYYNDGYSSSFLYQNGLTVTFEARTSMPIPKNSWGNEGFPYAKRIVFPEGITEIPRNWQLWSVEEIYLSSTITKLDRSFLASCYELTKITVAENSPFFRVMDGVVYHINTNSTYELFFFNDDLVTDDGVFTLPKEVSGINVCNNPGEITEFALEEGNRYLRIIDGAIYNFEVTKLLLVPAGKTGKFVPENGCEISDFALLNCYGITEVDFSAGSAYYYGRNTDFSFLNTCTSLEKVVFPYYGYIYIYGGEFNTFEYLKEVDFGCVRDIYHSCYDCPSLEQVRFSSAYIGYSFTGCDALESVTIPKSVEEIYGSFNDCSNLKAVYFENADIQLRSSYGDPSVTSFQNCSEELTFYAPAGGNIEELAAECNAKFVPLTDATFTIKYMLDSESGEMNSDDNPDSYNKDSEKIILSDATKPGYEFLGWFTDSKYTNQITEINPADLKNYVLYPKWGEIVTITLMENESDIFKEVTGIKDSLFDDFMLGAEYPEMAGYTFIGWETEDGYAMDSNTVITEDIILYPIWGSDEEYYVCAPVIYSYNDKIVAGSADYGTFFIYSSTPDVLIYYTLDGMNPVDEEGNLTESAKLYGGSVFLEEYDDTSITIKAIAISMKNTDIRSALTSHKFNVTPSSAWGDLDENARNMYKLPDEIPAGIWVFDKATVKDVDSYYDASYYHPDFSKYMWYLDDRFDVYYGKTRLYNYSNYKISYKNINKAAKATDKNAPTLIITGKGCYEGTYKQTFTLKPHGFGVDDCYVNISGYTSELVYNGKTQKQKPVVMVRNKKLTLGKDYELIYSSGTCSGIKGGTEEITVTVKGINNYSGTKTFTYRIKDGIHIKKCQVSGIKSSYNSSDFYDISKDIVVKYNGVILKSGTDYYISLNSSDSKGYITISGIGDYAGSVTKTCKITRPKAVDTRVNLSKATVSNFKPTVEFAGYNNKQKVTLTLKVDDEIRELKEYRDYNVSYKKNGSVGTATMTITGCGDYKGTIKKNFKITPFDIKADSLSDKPKFKLNDIPEFLSMTSNGVVPTVKGNFISGYFNNDIYIYQTEDFKVTYKNVSKVGTVEELGNKAATIVITGKGNFKGTLEYKVDVIKGSVGQEKITYTPVQYKNKAGNYKTKVKVGKNLVLNKDYTLKYTYYENTVLADGTVKKAGTEIGENEVVPANTWVELIITATGNRVVGEVKKIYKVYSKSVTTAKVTLKQPLQYNPRDIYDISADNLIVKLSDGTVLNKEDYEISYSAYGTNCNITIIGKGNYDGTKTVKIKINKAKFK